MVDESGGEPPGDTQNTERIGWHSAFFEAIQLELAGYRDVLRFIAEYQLTTEPLRIDVLIIKKAAEVVIEKNIAAIFRRENLVEYKSPGDYVPVADFYKVYGYACLYASLNKTAMRDVTISFIESRYPRDLLAHLREERGYGVEERWPGIYRVKGDIVGIQIIDSRKLSVEENLWLKNLSNTLEASDLRRVAEEINRYGKVFQVKAYLEAVIRANFGKVEEAFKMSDGVLTLDKVLENMGLVAKWEARGEARGRALGEARGAEKKALEIAKNLLGNGFSAEQAAELAGVDIEKIKLAAASKA